MTGAGDSDDVDDVDISPWSADDVPVRSTPLEFAWTKRPRPADEPDQPVEFRTPHVGRTDASGRSNGDHSRQGGRRRRALAIAGALVLAAVVILVAVRPDDPAASPTRADTKEDTADTDETTDADAEQDVTTTLAVFPQRPPGAADDEEGTSTDAAVTAVELPPAVAAIHAPTEIVMVNEEGSVATLSLPSGRVRTVHVGEDAFGGFASQLAVAPDATAMGAGETGVVIVPRAGPPLTVEPDVLGGTNGGFHVDGWYRASDGTSAFTVIAYTTGQAVRYDVDAQGGVTEIGPVIQAGYAAAAVPTPDGSRIVNDAGGAYEIAGDGTSRRIDDGFVHAATGDHRLVRRCDESQACSVGLITVSTGEFAVLDPALLPDDFDQLLYGAALSPDGSAVALRRELGVPERVLVVFGVGETASSPFGGWSPTAAWAADGSGVFDIPNGGAGVQFTSVDGGEPVVFGEDLGRLTALGVRWPDAEIEPTRTTVTRVVAAATPVGPTGITLVAAARTGSMSYIDIDAGRAPTWETVARLGRRSATLLAGSGGETLVLPETAADAFVTSPAREQVLAEVFRVDGDKLAGPDIDTVWVPSPDGAREGDVVYFLLPITATSTDEALATVDIPGAELIGGDGRGGLVVARGGDVFVVDPASSRRLTSGELVALSADTAYLRECEDPVSCTLVRVDRVSGARTLIEGVDSAGFAGVQPARGAALSSSIAPGGDVVVARIPVTVVAQDGTGSVERSWALVDLTDGRVTVVDDLDVRQPVIWSPDARFAVVQSDRELQIYDRAAGAMIPLDIDQVIAIGPVPPDWAPVP